MTANEGLAEPSERPVDRLGPFPEDDVERWILDARGGCHESLGRLSERCRQYLLLVANKELETELRGKVGASDVVQETMLTAQQIFSRFDGQSELQLRLWLRQILLHTLAHLERFYGQTAKRSIQREQPLASDGSRNAWIGLVDEAPTPRANAIANERTATIERTICELPGNYQQVIRLRCFEQLSFVQIGELLNASPGAVRKMWCRAIDALGRKWAARDESH